MIGDSARWKAELIRIADRLERRQSQRRWTEHTLFLMERDIIVAAYAIRKLMEAKKLSDDVTSRDVVVIQHPLSGRVPDLMSYERFWEHYDLNDGIEYVMSVEDFCNQIIHSFNWAVVYNRDERRAGIFVSSDRARRRVLYFADIDWIVVLLRAVGYDDVVSMQMERDPSGDLKVLSLVGADTRTARYEWLMTKGSPLRG